MFYSKQTSGFYDAEIHAGQIPDDAVEITPEQHAALLEGQSQGKQIVGDENGQPILVDPVAPVLTYAEKRAMAYPSIADQLDLLYHGGYDAWKSAITAVKEEFPKWQS